MGRPKGKQTQTEHRAHLDSRAASFGNAPCQVCGGQFPHYTASQLVCQSAKCRTKWARMQREARMAADPYWGKAWSLTGSVRLKNKREIVRGMLTRTVGAGCEYCGTRITLENASLDHRTPRTFSRVYSRSRRTRRYTKREFALLDSEANLHIVCRSCNQLKGNMNDEQFRTFSSFMNQRPDIRELILIRLKMATFFWKQHRR